MPNLGVAFGNIITDIRVCNVNIFIEFGEY